jgi:putative membrane protein insertion efficiency factor
MPIPSVGAMVSFVRAAVSAVVSAPALGLIRAYQLVISPMRPPVCRFYPSCSAYAFTAIERFGILRGLWLTTRRLLRCHPWNPGGVDHVPQADVAHAHPTRPEHDGDQPGIPVDPATPPVRAHLTPLQRNQC